MILPPNLYKKYLDRFDELIQEGQDIYSAIKVEPGEYYPLRDSAKLLGIRPGKAPDTYIVDSQAFAKWRINCISLLDQIIPCDSIQRKLIEDPELAYNTKGNLENHLAILRAIREDFEKGFLGDLSLQIEAEIAADYMSQAEQLLDEGQSGQYDHVPAAVLAGAVLEKGLRTLCTKQVPPLPLMDTNGKPLMMNRLIDDLKKAGAFNELKAKQLRAWADIRNQAAHGEFDQFDRKDAETMLGGIKNFLADHL